MSSLDIHESAECFCTDSCVRGDADSTCDCASCGHPEARLCYRCGDPVTSIDPEYRYCRDCHYSGMGEHTDNYADLIQAFEALPNVSSAHIHHSGGGCFGIAIDMADGRMGYVTDAYRDESGELTYDASLDNGPSGLSFVAIYASVEAFYDGSEEPAGEYGTGAHLVEWLARQ